MTDGWELVSERPGGTVSSLFVGGEACVLAVTTAAVHRSVDGGVTWSTLSAGRLTPPLNALAQSGAGLFVGGQSGLARSRDFGHSWSVVLGDATVVCLDVTLDAGRRVLLAGTQTEGLLRSEDEGVSWTSANPGLLDPAVLCLASTPEGISFAGTPTGVYRSSNAGRSWREVDLPCGPVAVECLAAASDALVLAGTDSTGTFVSRDGGRNWLPVPGPVASAITALSIGSNGRLLAVGSPDGVVVSRDEGATWQFDPIGTVLSLAWLPDALLAGVAGEGILRLDATGSAWRPASSGLHGRVIVDLAWSGQTRTLLTADVEAGVQRSTDAGRTWQSSDDGSLAVAHLAVGAEMAYAASTSGLSASHDAGLTWSTVRSGAGAIAVATASTGASLAAFDDDRLVLIGRDGEARCLDWEPSHGRIVSVAVWDTDLLFAGAIGERSYVWRSIDGGRVWTEWFRTERVPGLCMAISPNFGVDEQLLIGAGTRVFRPLRHAREHSGSGVRPLWLGTLLGEPVTAVVFGAAPGNVYAATASGVQRSLDGAEHFARWSEGLPAHLPVLALQSTPEAIYALGFGGTLWRIAQIEPV